MGEHFFHISQIFSKACHPFILLSVCLSSIILKQWDGNANKNHDEILPKGMALWGGKAVPGLFRLTATHRLTTHTISQAPQDLLPVTPDTIDSLILLIPLLANP